MALFQGMEVRRVVVTGMGVFHALEIPKQKFCIP